jgi:hypothetical protein
VTVDGGDWYLVGPDEWLEGRLIAAVFPNPKPPEGVENGRWIEINLAEQTLAVYDGGRMVFATVVSTGGSGSLPVYVRGAMLIPFVFVLAFLGAYLSEGAWQNMLLLVGIGVLGYFLRKYGWPRPPFVIGLVLGPIAEDSLNKALAIWGPTFFLRPLSLLFIAMIVASILYYIWQSIRRTGVEVPTDV